MAIAGSPTSASAIESRCFWPPDSFLNAPSRFSASPRSLDELLPVGRLGVERGVQVERLPDLDLVGQLALLELDADLLAERVAVAPGIEPEHA